MNIPRPINVAKVFTRIENWPDAVRLRYGLAPADLTELRFRNGLRISCRPELGDWGVVRELLIEDGYGAAFEYLKTLDRQSVVLDLGANIGCFSLLVADRNPSVIVHAYEPGEPNAQLFDANVAANPQVAGRIQLHREAVGGSSRTAIWHFDARNPGGSSLYGRGGPEQKVWIRSFADIVHAHGPDIGLAKIDIEGAEYELVAQTPPHVWQHVQAIAIELHDSPIQGYGRDALLRQLESVGYRARADGRFALFLVRS